MRQPRLGLDAGRGQQIDITEFVRVATEVAGFHPALVDQGAQGVVEFAQGNAGVAGKLALAGLRGLGEAAQQADAEVIGGVGHGVFRA